MKIKIASVFLISALIIVFTYCQSSTEPGESFNDPREMIWKADTLSMNDWALQLLPQDLLVESPENIWLAAWIGHGQVYHFDGAAWEMSNEIGGGISCLEKGPSSNTIWAGGYIGRDVNGEFKQNAYIGFYKENVWYDNEFQIQTELLDMYKAPDGNVWSCGRNGIIMKHVANNWEADTLLVGYRKSYPDAEFVAHSIEYYKDQMYVLASIYDFKRGNDIHYCITGSLHNWTVKDSMLINSPTSPLLFGSSRLYASSYGKLYSVGVLGVWEMQNNSWVKLYTSNSSIYGIYGVSERYLFAVGANALVFYDGNSWNSLIDIFHSSLESPIVFTNVWTDGNETIIAGYGLFNGKQRTIIWHGK